MLLATLNPLKAGEVKLQCVPEDNLHYVLMAVSARPAGKSYSASLLCSECGQIVNVKASAFDRAGE